jgi:hypothetical protein
MNRTYPADTCGLLNENLKLSVFQAITIPSERAVVKIIPGNRETGRTSSARRDEPGNSKQNPSAPFYFAAIIYLVQLNNA